MRSPDRSPPPADGRRARRAGLTALAAALTTGCAVGAPVGPVPATPATPSTSTAPTAVPSASSAPTTAPVVVLDPGHNGGNGSHSRDITRLVPDGRGGMKACNTTGTSTDAGYPEHAFTFDVALRMRTLLQAAGLRVVLTRSDDTGVGPCVDERGKAGEKAGAVAEVEIHADGAAASGSGFHVALSDPPLAPAQVGPAHTLGIALRDALRAGGFHDSTYIGHDGISLRSDLAGLNFATRPTALVECANMRNPREAAVVSSPEGRQRYADALARGVLAFLGR